MSTSQLVCLALDRRYEIIIKSNPEIAIELDSDEDAPKEVIDIAPRSDIKSEPEREPEPIVKAKRGRPSKSGARCSNCGEAGHNKKTCTEKLPSKKPSKDDGPFDNDLADKIEGMKEEGFSAEYIADDLRLPLDIVKRYW